MSDDTPREIYTHGHPAPVLQSHRWRTVENSAGYLLSRLSPGTAVLDVGCGPGTITADIARRVHPGRVIGIDSSAEVVTLAAAEHRAVNLTFRSGDVYELAEPPDTFDVVHAHQVLQHLGDPVRALVEMRRVCRRGGTVAVRDADYGAMVWWPDESGLRRWLDVYRAVAHANGGEPDAGRRLVAWFHAAGYSNVTASASTWCFATEDDRAWWAQTWAQRITDSPLADRAVQLGVASRDDLDGSAAAWRRWAEHGDGYFVTVHGEVLATV
jgi:SAM-dependent methyltransferase